MVKILKGATGARNYSQCDSLLLGDQCVAHTFPYLEVKNTSSQVEHEASTSKIGEDQIFYCRQRGISAEDAVSMIVHGFCKEVFRELPMEFAVEAQRHWRFTNAEDRVHPKYQRPVVYVRNQGLCLVVEPFLITKERIDDHHGCTHKMVVEIVVENTELHQDSVTNFISHSCEVVYPLSRPVPRARRASKRSQCIGPLILSRAHSTERLLCH
jgi:hypothetical protein